MNHETHEQHEKDNSDLGHTEYTEMEPAKGHFLVYQTEAGNVKLDVRLEDETVWLTQPLMADLFQTTQQNISQHVQNIYDEGELIRGATHKKFLSVRREGKRDVRLELDYYNLYMIIAEDNMVP
jgi:hypothetical protein